MIYDLKQWCPFIIFITIADLRVHFFFGFRIKDLVHWSLSMDVEFELSQQLQGHESQVWMQGCRAPYEVFQSSNLDHFSIETHGDLGIPHDSYRSV